MIPDELRTYVQESYPRLTDAEVELKCIELMEKKRRFARYINDELPATLKYNKGGE